MARLVTGKRRLAEDLGMSEAQLRKVWRKWAAMDGFPGPAPGYSSVYNADAFHAWLDAFAAASQNKPPANSNRQPPQPAVKADWSSRMASAAATIAGDF